MNVMPLNRINTDNGHLFGKKAQNLGRLIKSGFKVPEGFCISSMAYDEHVKRSRINELIEKIRDNKKETLSQIKEAIIKEPLDENLVKKIKTHFSFIQSPTVAVRSSGTAEDMEGCSFAGQYDTFLDVTNYEDCLMAIKKCWASMWSERVYEYREKYGFNHSEVSMSVIVQKMIMGDFSGVTFTEDPRGGKCNMVIEYCKGTGDNLVSGSITPERIILKKKNLKIENNHRLIDKKTLKILIGYSMKIEDIFKSPQDIEWTLKGKDLYFLQARPITTNKKSKYIWTNANAGEVLPDVACPMTWSMVKLIINHIFQPFGIEPEKTELIGLIAGKAYFNMNSMEGILRKFPGFKKETFSEMLGGMEVKIPVISDNSIPEININPVKLIIKFLNLFILSCNRPSKSLKNINNLKKHAQELIKTNFTYFSDEELFCHFKSVLNEIDKNTELIMPVASGMHYFFIFKYITKKWLQDDDISIANKLMTTIGGMDSAESGIHLGELALLVCKNPVVKDLILSGKDFDEIKENLKETKEGKEFLISWDKFMENHGHHTRGEIDVMNPRWSEMPDYILKQIRAYVREDYKFNNDHKSKEKKELISQIQLKLNPLKRLIFNYILFQGEKGLICRENLKSNMIRYIAAIRLTLIELEKRLIKKGILKDKNDIFFIDLKELDSLAEGKADVHLSNIIEKRRKEYEKNLTLSPPPVIIGEFDPENYIPEEVLIKTELKGFPVSPGLVTGIAKVIMRSDMEETIEAGEILVAPFTDPGWTPYFISAKAIVMDMGGMLSHGSIVARELGIPAVVNVGAATKIIKTGDKIQVDGNKGIVRIMSDG